MLSKNMHQEVGLVTGIREREVKDLVYRKDNQRRIHNSMSSLNSTGTREVPGFARRSTAGVYLMLPPIPLGQTREPNLEISYHSSFVER